MEENHVLARRRQAELRRLRKGKRIKTTLNMSPATKEQMRTAAQALYMNHSDFIEWLLNKYAKGLLAA